jgi:hypothetical protein
MRGVSKVVIRGVLAASIVLALAVPAQAKPREGRWFEQRVDPIVKMIKKLVIRSLGDGLSDPWPKPKP